MMFWRKILFFRFPFSFLPIEMLILIALMLLASLALAQQQTPDQVATHQWAGNWLVVGQGDEQLVWQLKVDGTGFAHGFDAAGQLTHGFAIAWQIDRNLVRVRTSGTLRCNGGMIHAQFTDRSSVSLNFLVLDGRHWRQQNGGILAFQRRLPQWKTPSHGSKCPNLYQKENSG
ncbi:MAG: hypothetical protein K0U59_11290 [Gammaproteobacteria bacterium]|nr:hypothetical protein [Gammaproteobacteria bacterium]